MPLDRWWMIQYSCQVLSYLMESRATWPAAFQNTVCSQMTLWEARTCLWWCLLLPHVTQTWQNCCPCLVVSHFMSAQRTLEVRYFPSCWTLLRVRFVCESIYIWTEVHASFFWKGMEKSIESSTENERSLGTGALHTSPFSAFKMTTNRLIPVSGMNCHFVFSVIEASNSGVSLGPFLCTVWSCL